MWILLFASLVLYGLGLNTSDSNFIYDLHIRIKFKHVPVFLCLLEEALLYQYVQDFYCRLSAPHCSWRFETPLVQTGSKFYVQTQPNLIIKYMYEDQYVANSLVNKLTEFTQTAVNLSLYILQYSSNSSVYLNAHYPRTESTNKF